MRAKHSCEFCTELGTEGTGRPVKEKFLPPAGEVRLVDLSLPELDAFFDQLAVLVAHDGEAQ